MLLFKTYFFKLLNVIYLEASFELFLDILMCRGKFLAVLLTLEVLKALFTIEFKLFFVIVP